LSGPHTRPGAAHAQAGPLQGHAATNPPATVPVCSACPTPNPLSFPLLRPQRSCQDCPENTAVNRRGSKCVANPGYYGNGLECPEDYYCALGAPWKW
jgi:hypothetical protein